MKILGNQNRTYVVQMSEEELQDLTGLSFHYGKVNLSGRWTDLWPNFDAKIRDGWQRLHGLNQNREELAKSIRQLRAVADILEPLELIVAGDAPPAPASEPAAPPL